MVYCLGLPLIYLLWKLTQMDQLGSQQSQVQCLHLVQVLEPWKGVPELQFLLDRSKHRWALLSVHLMQAEDAHRCLERQAELS